MIESTNELTLYYLSECFSSVDAGLLLSYVYDSVHDVVVCSKLDLFILVISFFYFHCYLINVNYTILNSHCQHLIVTIFSHFKI